MHLAIAKLVMAEYPVHDPARFLYGSLLPDSARAGNSHWRISCGGGLQTIDLSGFRRKFGRALQTDDLLKGYYLHLVQDLLFHQHLLASSDWKASKHYARLLHCDYERLNHVLTEKYDLKELASSLQEQRITEALQDDIVFDGQELLEAILRDTQLRRRKRAAFFTEEMAHEYIIEAARKCTEEMRALESGESILGRTKASWEWGTPGLLFRIRRKLRHLFLEKL